MSPKFYSDSSLQVAHEPFLGQMALSLQHFSHQKPLLPQQPLPQPNPPQKVQLQHQEPLHISFPPLIKQLEKTATQSKTDRSAATSLAPPPPSPPPHPLHPVASALPFSVHPPSAPPLSPTTHFPAPTYLRPPPPRHLSTTPQSPPLIPQSSLASPSNTCNPHSPLSSMLPCTSYHSGNSPDSPERPSCRNIDVNSINKIRIFAQQFKELRHKYGYSQADVAREVLLRFNFETCDEQISLFETSSLAFEEMSTMKTLLEKWVLEIIQRQEKSKEEVNSIQLWLSNYHHQRQKRTIIPVKKKYALLNEFKANPKPSTQKLKLIAEQLDLKLGVTKTWFNNMRQLSKARKSNDNEDEEVYVVEEEEKN